MMYGLATAARILVIFFIMCHRILAISLSSNNEVEELSVIQRSVSCEQLSPNSMVSWSIAPLYGQVKQVGMCEAGKCTSAYRPHVYPERLDPESSSLVLLNVTRQWAGTVVCTERFINGSEQSVNSTLDVYYNSGVTNISMMVNPEDWTLIVSFNVAKVFSARGNYGAELDCPSLTPIVNVSLVSSNESSLMYNMGYFLLTVLKSHGDPYVYFMCLSTIIVHPGEKIVRLTQTETGGFQEPSLPEIDCDLDYIPEDGPFNCICDSGGLGNPEGRLRWRLGEQVLTSGDYGVKRLLLPSDIVNRSHHGEDLVCDLEWLYNKHSEMNILVAYGPDEVVIKPFSILYVKDSSNGTFPAAYPAISGCEYLLTDDISEVNLMCEARNVQPLKSEMVTWGGLCDGQQGFTCNLTFTGKKDDGKEVTCSVTNDANNNHTAYASIIVNVSGCEGKDDPMSKGVVSGAGVTLTLHILVVGVVVVVI